MFIVQDGLSIKYIYSTLLRSINVLNILLMERIKNVVLVMNDRFLILD